MSAHSELIADKARKLPTQERAIKTVEAIFEATAQIASDEGVAAVNTNKIAKRAGFSIGTLYQYFPSKEAILAAMTARERIRLVKELDALLLAAETSGLGQSNPQEMVRRYIQLISKVLLGTKTVKGQFVRMAWQSDTYDESLEAIKQIAERIAISVQRLAHPMLRAPTPASIFVITRAMVGILRSASLENSPLKGSIELEDELVRLAWAILAK
jgi:AcrR family transcriptional regulator